MASWSRFDFLLCVVERSWECSHGGVHSFQEGAYRPSYLPDYFGLLRSEDTSPIPAFNNLLLVDAIALEMV